MFLALAVVLAAAAAPVPHANIDRLLAQMTAEEKIGQLMQYTPDKPTFADAIAHGRVGAVLGIRNAAEANEVQRRVLAGSRLKIPLLIGHDVIHGYRTIFPVPIAIASSWDPALAEESARVAAREARRGGVQWTFAPMVDIARDPRWGRIMEGAGEDPFLGSAFAGAYVRGFQSGGILACAKHYAAYGAAEGGRDYGATEMSERTLREVYLPPYKAAVDAGVASVMSAFNALNGVPATANAHLLDEILRKEWKFKGFVVSDWAAVQQLIAHGVAADHRDAAIKAIRAGVDLDMWDEAYATLGGAVPQSTLDRSVRRILQAKVNAGLFENAFTAEGDVRPTAETRAVARRVAQRSIVLLKNDGILPLARSSKIAVVGPLADSKDDMLGNWAAEGKAEDCITVRDAIASVDLDAADVIVAVVGETRHMSGEAASRATLDLPDDQQSLLESLAAKGKPLVVVVMAGRPLTIPWIAEHATAVVYAWFLGVESGNAVGDVLFGDVNPSAKLPVTFPRAVGQVPIYYSMLPSGRPGTVEDKYTNKYIDLPLGPLYPFGFGLSYTRFEYSNLAVSGMTIGADIRNAGSRAGEEIVQLYVNRPVSAVSRPLKLLKGFKRIALAPGETKRVTFTIKPDDLQVWSANGWTVERGKYNVWIGPDSAHGLAGTFDYASSAARR